MSTPNEMDEAFVALPDLALGLLPAAEAERLMRVVNAAPKLQAELASLRGATDALAHAAPPAGSLTNDTKAAMRERLLARAKAPERDAGITPPVARPAAALRLEPRDAAAGVPVREIRVPAQLSLIQRAAPFLAIAASVLFAVSVVRLRDTLNERNDAQAALAAATSATTELQQKVAASDSLVAAMSGATVRVVEMVSTQKLPPSARMFWDRATNRWTMVMHDLKPTSAGRTYQLWLVTATSEKISAGTFDTDSRGGAIVRATYALAESDLAAIAVTEEPSGGSPQPTGTILVAGAPTR